MLQVVSQDERFSPQTQFALGNCNSLYPRHNNGISMNPQSGGAWMTLMNGYPGGMMTPHYGAPGYYWDQIPTSPSQTIPYVPFHWLAPQASYSIPVSPANSSNNLGWPHSPQCDMLQPQYTRMSSVPLIASSTRYAPNHIGQFDYPGSVSPSRSPVRNDVSVDQFRGPPRKPQMTGYAVWVGNIPPDAHIIDLRDHFSQGSPSSSPQSVFLLPRSNCAFLNFKTWESCVDIVHKFHNIPFNGSKLICRLRRPVKQPKSKSTEADEANSSKSSANSEGASRLNNPNTESSPSSISSTSNLIVTSRPPASPRRRTRVPERFFVVKCLTMTDFDMSVRTGLWATQGTNEDKLDVAYESAENVYLLFSINKSGAYCGYARMASPIGSESTHLTRLHETGGVPSPTSPNFAGIIETPATPFSLKGRIIDDQERGSVFWEADSTPGSPRTATTTAARGSISNEELDDVERSGPTDSHEGGDGAGTDGESASTGECRPFKVEWKSTKWVSFSRTHGLRNPWNMNREVKIARDGTELEPVVGRKLLQMFG